jgi:hypothetical protein
LNPLALRLGSCRAERCLAIGGPDAPEIVLTVEDVARIAVVAVSAAGAENAVRAGQAA